jgi:hypothetical protein
MINTLETQGLINKLKIEIFDNKILVYKKSIFNYVEYEVSFDDIDNKKKVKKEFNHGIMIIALFGFCFGVIFSMAGNVEVLAILFLISGVMFIIGLLTQRKYIHINTFTEGTLELKFTNKNEKEVREFADKIINMTNHYLIEKYSKVDKDLPIENQINNLNFLKNKELIDDNKFEELKNILIGRKSEEKAIGFN